MEEIEDSEYRSVYVEQLISNGYPLYWIDETKYGALVGDEDINLYYIVEAAVSKVSELMRYLRRNVRKADLLDMDSSEEWLKQMYDEWPISGRTLSTGRVLKKNAGEISLTILAEVFAWYHDDVDTLMIYTQDTDAHEFQTSAEQKLKGKERLIPDEIVHTGDANHAVNNACGGKGKNTSYGYHMSDEDFYIYITSHAYKHYSGSGTGLRTLLDFYAYLNAKEATLDFDYIQAECKKLGIDDFEQHNRILCRKVFAPQQTYDLASFKQSLSADELEMLQYYLSSGVYGTFDRMVANRMEKQKKADGKKNLSKLSYYRHRVFPGMELYENYPLLVKHKWLIPAYWCYRIVRLLFSKKRRDYVLCEVKAVEKVAVRKNNTKAK
ncbi:nucleotidyltransferase family protein [Ruminococcus sp. AF31-8BH]|uniref:nucleotidyltransferase family protein n=1 Tax=Ruminococcus sp. AF31-8BH TaxID=2293174 RepID=UPI000E4C9DA8|nr:nucleotidyltransferase family protein [Ruminococcus sp. AF31-8BH]RGF72601.1 hypothetical protein DWZ38_14355 [Ruminococcus sp. AF31-8BH]